jgi:PIN domain-containing protein
VRFFFDNTFPPRLVQAIRVLAELQEVDLTHLADKFPRDSPDPVWIGALGVEGDWIIISSDANICRGKAEQAAWRESGLTAFFFVDLSRQAYYAQAAEVIRWWPQIVLTARQATPGTGFRLLRSGKEPERIIVERRRGR